MIIKVKVKPNSDKFRIKLVKRGEKSFLKIWLTEAPKKSKANKELLKELRKRFGSVELVSGLNSREKYIKVEDNIKELEEKI